MSYKVKKAAVLGSGVMGSGIACHLANVGIDVLMLDIQPNDKSIKNKNIIADESLKNAIKSRPNPLYKKEYANRVTTGNFDDDFEKIKDADWIIEVIVENLEIKKTVFEKLKNINLIMLLLLLTLLVFQYHFCAKEDQMILNLNFVEHISLILQDI